MEILALKRKREFAQMWNFILQTALSAERRQQVLTIIPSSNCFVMAVLLCPLNMTGSNRLLAPVCSSRLYSLVSAALDKHPTCKWYEYLQETRFSKMEAERVFDRSVLGSWLPNYGDWCFMICSLIPFCSLLLQV